MTNEQFSGQLRQHLLGTADERMAEGQLASIVDRVAVTSQRSTLVARLPWFQGRVGSSQTSQLGWGLVALALIGAIFAGTVFVGGSAPRSTGVEGTWTASDPVDGSTRFLVVAAGKTPAVRYMDEMAAGYVCGDNPQMPFVADGTGAVEGSRLHVTWTATNGCDFDSIPASDGYTYDKTTDTLVDDIPTTWTRAGDGLVVPTRGPTPRIDTTAPAESSAPSDPPTADCIQFDAPGTYTAREGSLSLTVGVPGTPADPWIGSRSEFNLLKAACTDWSGPGAIDAGEVTLVHNDACDGQAVHTLDDAIAAVSTSKGIDVVAKTDVTLGGHPGTRFDIFVHEDANACTNGVVDGVTLERGVNLRLYLIDVDGKTLALALYGHPLWSPDVRATVDEILASLQIESRAPSDPPNGQCVVFDGPGSYTAPAGSLSLTVDVPASAEEPWHGLRDGFSLLSKPCLFGGARIDGSTINVVYPDACGRPGTAVTVDTTAEAIAAVAAITGVEVSDPTDVTIGGYEGKRFVITVPPGYVETACNDGAVVVADDMTNLDPGVTTLYLLDVDGTTLALAVIGIEDGDPALTSLFNQVLASMQIER